MSQLKPNNYWSIQGTDKTRANKNGIMLIPLLHFQQWTLSDPAYSGVVDFQMVTLIGPSSILVDLLFSISKGRADFSSSYSIHFTPYLVGRKESKPYRFVPLLRLQLLNPTSTDLLNRAVFVGSN